MSAADPLNASGTIELVMPDTQAPRKTALNPAA